MALKDWKKIRSSAKVKGYMNIWHNNKINMMISIYGVKESRGNDNSYSKLYKHKYNVDIASTKEAFLVFVRKSFKTKKEALKYVRAYMRKH